MPLLTFTGNPLIDTGNAVITAMCGKECFGEVTKEDIIKNIDAFLEVIENHFCEPSATPKELGFAKRGLKQHFALLYTTNHYLFGINNKIKNPDTGKKETVQTGTQFIKTFKKEVLDILEGNNRLTQSAERKSEGNICKFCGRPAELIITKDIVPLATALTQKNLGQVHSCSYCYLPILFSFVTMINVRNTENSMGMYMFYHFANERYMVEYARQQFRELKGAMMASLQTKKGSQYEVVAEDLLDRLSRFQRKFEKGNSFHGYTTAYYILNDNRGASFKYINVPDGICNFLIQIHNVQDIWKQIKRNLNSSEDYKKFFSGDFLCTWQDGTPKYGFEKSEVISLYLKEVSHVDEKFIRATENIGSGLAKYYRSFFKKQWVEEYEKKMNVEKPYAFINGLLDINEKYFKLNGDNIFAISDVKQILGENSALAFRLIKYFVCDNMTEDEKQTFVDINREKRNKNQQEGVD